MNILNEWMAINGVSERAMVDLYRILAASSIVATSKGNASESHVMKNAQLSAARSGDVLWRNNVGAMVGDDGRVTRFGLCNVSKKMNSNIKSADLIGIKKVEITQEMVGKIIGQFYARETKRGGWHYSNTDRERAQLHFITLVNSLGGDAAFLSGDL